MENEYLKALLRLLDPEGPARQDRVDLLSQLLSGSIPLFAHLGGNTRPIGTIQVDFDAVGMLIRAHVHGREHSSKLYSALNRSVTEPQTQNAQIEAALGKLIDETIVPFAALSFLTGLSFAGQASDVDDRVNQSIKAILDGLDFCAICRQPFKRTRKMPETCRQPACRDAFQHRPPKPPKSRRDEARVRRQRQSGAKFKTRLLAALERHHRKANAETDFAGLVDADPKFTNDVELLAETDKPLANALKTVRRYKNGHRRKTN